MESMEEILQQRQLDRNWSDWCDKVKKKLPALSKRIFRLRRKHYMGCGFHYSMEGSLGNLIHKVNSPSAWPRGEWIEKETFRMCMEVNYKFLVEEVKEAEISAGLRKAI